MAPLKSTFLIVLVLFGAFVQARVLDTRTRRYWKPSEEAGKAEVDVKPKKVVFDGVLPPLCLALDLTKFPDFRRHCKELSSYDVVQKKYVGPKLNSTTTEQDGFFMRGT